MAKLGSASNPRLVTVAPLGNNSVEGSAPGHATPTDTTPRDVPVVFDDFTGQYIAKLSHQNQVDREKSLELARIQNEDIRFLRQVGYQGGQ